MRRGWVAIHRKIVDWEWYQDANTFRVFIHLLIGAKYSPGKWRGESLSPGQLVTGRIQLSQALKMSEQSIRTSLKRLKSTGEITIKSTNQYSVITLLNWDSYQNSVKSSNQQSNQLLNHLATNEQPATNHIQQSNKVKKGRKKSKRGDESPAIVGEKRQVKKNKEEAEEAWGTVLTACSRGTYKAINSKGHDIVVRELGGYERVGGANKWDLKEIKSDFMKAYL